MNEQNDENIKDSSSSLSDRSSLLSLQEEIWLNRAVKYSKWVLGGLVLIGLLTKSWWMLSFLCLLIGLAILGVICLTFVHRDSNDMLTIPRGIAFCTSGLLYVAGGISEMLSSKTGVGSYG